MAGLSNTTQNGLPSLPITKNGYQFTNWGEYREVQWLVSDGTFASLEEYADVTRRLLAKVEAKEKEKERRLL